jgi:hypothetical protein
VSENAAPPDHRRSRRPWGRFLAAATALGLVAAVVSGVPARGAPNMVTNGDLSGGTGDTFDCFVVSGWGTNTSSLKSVTGADGTGRAARLDISAHSTGDRKFIIRENDECGVEVRSGIAYDLWVTYRSTRVAEGAFYRKTDAGWTWWYVPDGNLPATSTWTQTKVTTPPIPSDTLRVAWGFGLSGVGTLITDDYAQVPTGQAVDPSPGATLSPTATATTTSSSPVATTTSPTATTTTSTTTTTSSKPGKGKKATSTTTTTTTSAPATPTPEPTETASPAQTTASPTATGTATGSTTTGTSTNLVTNGLLAQGTGTPTCFTPSGWGSHTVTQGFDADIPTGSSGRSWRIAISGWSSGDRKLLMSETAGCAPQVTAGTFYTATVWYRSDRTVNGSFFRHSAGGWDGWYVPGATFPASSTWTRAVIDLPAIPAGTDLISFGLAIEGDGTLLTHDYRLTAEPAEPISGGTTSTPPSSTSASPTSTATSPDPEPTEVAPLVIGPGEWTVAGRQMNLRAMHATLLRDGRVLLVAGSGNDPAMLEAGTFLSSVWDPNSDTYTAVPTPVDMFCIGHVTLPDGRVLVSGGTKAYPGQNGAIGYEGLRDSFIFDPATNRYVRINDTIDAHWYPTLTKLENGDVWAAGGLNEFASGTLDVEMFSVAQNRWLPKSEVPQSGRFWGLYPHMFLMQDGRLFYSGAHTFGYNLPGSGASIHNWRTGATFDIPGLRDKDLRDQAGSVLLPPA